MTLVKIKTVSYANVKGYLLYNKDTVVLVDTGHKNTVKSLLSALSDISKQPSDVDLIILTHTHFDHAGGSREIRELTGAPLAVHREEAGYLQMGRTPFPRGTRWKGKLLVSAGRIFARGLSKYPPADPDILIGDEMDLAEYRIPGKVVHTPGHTSGSVSVLLETGEALVGDNVLGLSFKTHYPPFANDRQAVLESWQLYIDRGMKTLLPAHGGRVKIEALVRQLPGARQKYG
ncbi:MAG: MBL fold metallo-hydrolase [Bacteroidales bacterium]|nr:MBL fold metallo-hydrolase [Bacteroidales bacterium]MDT8431222.1 MBL fold metallo-hydrolase [Bacteroidales bacterium]